MNMIANKVYVNVTRRSSNLVKCIHILVISFLSNVVTAAPGDLDASFGINGKVVAAINDNVINVETQLDKKILVLTSKTISRYLPNGDIDLSFGVGGVVHSTAETSFRNFVIKKNGKIILLKDGAVMQLKSDGKVDTTFGGGDGEFSLDFLPVSYVSFIT